MTGVNEEAKKNLQTFKCQLRDVRSTSGWSTTRNNNKRREGIKNYTTRMDRDTHISIQTDKVNGRYWLLFVVMLILLPLPLLLLPLLLLLSFVMLVRCMACLYCTRILSNKNNYNGRKQINQCE